MPLLPSARGCHACEPESVLVLPSKVAARRCNSRSLGAQLNQLSSLKHLYWIRATRPAVFNRDCYRKQTPIGHNVKKITRPEPSSLIRVRKEQAVISQNCAEALTLTRVQLDRARLKKHTPDHSPTPLQLKPFTKRLIHQGGSVIGARGPRPSNRSVARRDCRSCCRFPVNA